MSKPKVSPFKGYRNMKRVNTSVQVIDNNSGKWKSGTINEWAEFKKTFYNALRLNRGWNLEKPAAEEETRIPRPSGVASEEEVTSLRARCAEAIQSLTEEETERFPAVVPPPEQPVPRGRAPPPVPQPTHQERVNELMTRNEYKRRRRDCEDSLRNEISKLNDRAESSLRQWTLENKEKDLRDAYTLKVFNEKFRSTDLNLVDAEYLQVGKFREALAQLEKMFVGSAPSGLTLVWEIRRTVKEGAFKYKKSEGLDFLTEKVESAHKAQKICEDITWGMVIEAINIGDDDLLKRQMESMIPSFTTYAKFKEIMKNQIIQNIHDPIRKRKESANVAQDPKPCTFCGSFGHSDSSCYTQKICDKCKKKGHIAKYCKSKNNSGEASQKESDGANQNKTQPKPKRKLDLVANFEETVGKSKK